MMTVAFVGTVILFIGYCSYCVAVVREEYIRITAKDVNTALKKEQVHQRVNILV